MRTLLKTCTLLALVVGAVTSDPLLAQQFSMTKSDGVVLILGDGRFAVLKADGARVLIGNLIDGEKAEGVRADIQAGDVIMRILGVRAPTMEQVNTTYEAIKVGDEVILGLRRGTAPEHEVRFKRPAVPGGGRPMAIAMEGGKAAAGAGAWVSGAGANAATEVVIAGAHIRENAEGMPEVTHRTADPAASTVPLRAGDVIVRINGRMIAALLGLQRFYTEAASGSQITLTLKREGQDMEIKFAKPADR
ncbi:MAG: PDZ domain-containing protein [Gemmatimonadales bacterium]|nr:PDZ domain-containing protein [Gemmatimonadales bacterium]